MSSIKIYPPNQLPAEGLTDTQFEIWKEELEVYLEIEEKFRKFLPGGRYQNWSAAEENEHRIEVNIAPDTPEKLPDIRRELRQFITIVAKFVHQDYYNPIVRHSTSLKWIYSKIRQDHNIERQGIHFFNIIDLKWDPTEQTTPIGFYNQYRSLIMGNLGKRGDVIEWKNETLKEDEKLTPSHEDFILLTVLQHLHSKLPQYVREHYAHKMGATKRLMDFKTEILSKAKQYIQEIELQDATTETHAATAAPEPECHYMQTSSSRGGFQQRGNYRQYQQRRNYQKPRNTYQKPQSSANSQTLPPFCRMCHIQGLPRHIYTSHYIGQTECPSMTQKDRQGLVNRVSQQLNGINIEDDDEDDDIAQMYGYGAPTATDDDQIGQVKSKIIPKPTVECNFIQPVPAQILTVQTAQQVSVHLDLDSGATVSYVKLSAVKNLGFKIGPNSQLSALADGNTKMKAIGEIDETLFRNNFTVRFNAIVTEKLHADFIAGTNFIKENGVIQDFNNRTITVHKKFVVPETCRSLIMPTKPSNVLLKNANIKVILPGQSVRIAVPHEDQTQLAIQPWHQSKSQDWPPPQVCVVNKGCIDIQNNNDEPIDTKSIHKIHARTISHTQTTPHDELKYPSPSINNEINNNIANISINTDNIDPDIIRLVDDIHQTYRDVFDENLSMGYNHMYGKHIVNLNWANNTRPQARKVQTINYDQETKVLLQKVCDDLTEKNVLGIPQDHDISIQYCSPCFLVRKSKAKNKPKDQLTKDDVRLVVNFGEINDHLKNLPTPITKPKQIFAQLGKWNYIITTDLYSGFFQNHVSIEDSPWLGICTPFGGLRFLKRSGQGLIGQSEELDELLCKILCQEMQQGKVARIADDLYIGGETQREAIDNYRDVLQKLSAANIKISASKTKIFLKSVDILGWKWSQGGFLSPSPHRVNAIKNAKHEDIKTVKDLRSWLGLYKTLLPASPNLTLLLHPFDLQVADRMSKDEVNWTRELIHDFNEATAAVDKLETLYLPHPHDQLLIEVDAAKVNPGIGHTLYAVKDGKKLPVSFHSVKLSDAHSKWMACELEALALAMAINAEMDTIKEAKKPVIISPDSKPVADAVKLIRKGNYSSSPRIQALINNINKVPFIIQLASGKNKLNASSDFQSRNTTPCHTEHCAVCNFVSDQSDSVLLPQCNNTKTEHFDTMTNKNAWNKIQNDYKACRETKKLLKSGKTPSKASGKINSEIRRLCSIAQLDQNDLLIVKAQQNKFSSNSKELTVVPQTHVPALLWQIHNNMNHPSKSQLKAQFDKNFYGVGLTSILDKIYDECFYCVSQKKIPATTMHHSKTEASVPGTHFHADVIRRQTQFIFTARDHISSYTTAKIIKNETHNELKKAIIDIIHPFKLHGECIVRVDNAKGFLPLLDKKDPELAKLNIKLEATDVHNKNSNAVIDRACQEVEDELKRIEPDGRPVSNTTLQQAVANLNLKLRRNGQISSYELQFNRDMHTGQNMNIDYEKVSKDQKQSREIVNDKHNKNVTPTANPHPGDTVIVKSKNDKHKAKDVFLVTDVKEEKVLMHKILHPYSQHQKIRAQQYVTDPQRLIVTRKNHHFLPQQPKQEQKVNKSSWNPIRSPDQSDDEDYQYYPPTSHQQPQPTLPEADSNSVQDQQEQEIIDSRDNTPSSSSSSSDASSAYASPAYASPAYASPINDSQRPEIYRLHDEWMRQQRANAARQLLLVNSETHPQPNHPPSDIQPTDHHNPQHQQNQEQVQQVDKRTIQKQQAKNKISAIYNRNIPQVDGYITDPSSSNSSSQQTTPDTTVIDDSFNNHRRHGFLSQVVTDYYDLLDRVDFLPQLSPASSQSWDYSYLHCDDDLDHIFQQPDFDTSFLPLARRHSC